MISRSLGVHWKTELAPKLLEEANKKQAEKGIREADFNDVTGAVITIHTETWYNTVMKLEQLTEENTRLQQLNDKLSSRKDETQRRVIQMENSLAMIIAKPDTSMDRGNQDKNTLPTPPAAQMATKTTEQKNVKNQVEKEIHAPRKPQDGNNEEETKQKGISWAKISKAHRPNKTQLPTYMTERIQRSAEILNARKIRTIRQPKPMAVYFKNNRRGQIGTIRRALRESLPLWALLGIGFVEGSVMEIITDTNLKERLIATLKLMGIAEIPGFDILDDTTRSEQKSGTNPTKSETNAPRVIRRMEY